jgi:hypothetical protein
MNKVIILFSVTCFIVFSEATNAAKLVEILSVDNQYLVLHFQDGMVEYNWDDNTSGSYNGWDFLHTENRHLCLIRINTFLLERL